MNYGKFVVPLHLQIINKQKYGNEILQGKRYGLHSL